MAKNQLFFCIIVFLLAADLPASQIEPVLREFHQPDGRTFAGRMLGDEWLAYAETAGGYTIVRDARGTWSYATPGPGGWLVASEHAVGSVDPEALGLEKHLRHADSALVDIRRRRQKFYDALQRLQPLKKLHMRAADRGRAKAAKVAYKLAVLLIAFPDAGATYAPQDFAGLLFSKGYSYTSPIPGEPAYGSLRDYYDHFSGGRLDITGQVFDWVMAGSSKAFYHNSDAFIGEAVAKSGVDLQQFDGYAVLYAGNVGPGGSRLWPETNVDGDKLFYIMSEQWLPKYRFAPIGVHCHEFGHLLGLPDLYDPDGSSAGIGTWGLMGSGNFGGGHQERPFSLSAWSRLQLDWLQPEVVYTAQSEQKSLPPIETGAAALKLISRESYFLLENRQKQGYDLNLPGSGLLIWHIDERFGNQSIDEHRLVHLERADNNETAGDAGDPFPGTSANRFFNALSQPGSQDYDGQSYVAVENIDIAGGTAQFDLSVNLGEASGITIDGSGEFPNVFTALETAVAGDTVIVPSGTFPAQRLLLKEGRHLRGQDAATAVLDGDGDTILRLQHVADVSVSHLTLADAGNAIVARGATGRILRNIIRDGIGIGILCSDASPEIRNNTIINVKSSGITCLAQAAPVISSNIIAYCNSGIAQSTTSAPVLRYNDVWNNARDYQGGAPGATDISADPRFVNFIFNDYYLLPGSPCIDAGDPQYTDPDGSRADIGALPFDLDHITGVTGIRVNAGGEAYLASDSSYFAPDQAYRKGAWGYLGGESHRTFDPIGNTADALLYQTERKGVQGYTFDIANGRYRITLHFCEIVWTEPGRRIFDVAIEGRTVLQDFDIFARIGHDRALRFDFYTDVLDGQLNLGFTPKIGFTQIGAIEVQSDQPMFVEVAKLFKIDHIGRSLSTALGDYNGDGFPDFFIANDDRANVLFQNNGSGLFTNVTRDADFLRSGGGTMGAWADYDNDGDLDLYVARSGITNILYNNNGDGTFSEVAAFAGVADAGKGVACAWADYNNDGQVDLYVANAGPDVFYRNSGKGTFSDITRYAGLQNDVISTDISFADVNDDGFVDLLVTHYDGVAARSNILYLNKGTGIFSPTTLGENGLGAAFGDYDNDGDPDVMLSSRSLSTGAPQIQLWRNDGRGKFIEVTAASGIDANREAVAVSWGDFDNDGFLDLAFFPEQGAGVLYRNDGQAAFIDISDSTGFEQHDLQRSLATGDVDGDGQLDLYICRFGQENLLYQNRGTGHNWLAVRLRGVDSNRSGIGARVRLVAGSVQQMRQVTSGTGFRAQNRLVAHFGLGDASRVDTLEITWPGGAVDSQTGITALNRVIEAVQGMPTAVAAETPVPSAFRLQANYPNPFRAGSDTRLVYELPRASRVQIKIYNLLGQEIRTLLDRLQPPGTHRLHWDGRDRTGRLASPGVYFLTLRAGEFRARRKVVVLGW